MQTLLNNRYQVIRTLGSGGFGETFVAEDIQMPSNRRCVIKQLRPIQNNPQIYQLVQERFQREAAILEELGGATNQIPTLYAYFQSDGQFYLVQEWIEGDTLTGKVYQQGLLSESTTREILVNLLPVLEYVHSKRIIHRDIKPDNIILRHRDSKPVLIDFGAVRESMGTVVNSQGNPTSSIVIGTPGFMPSEQAAGRPLYSSDLYSLGITVIYLLTGKQPQELETDPRTGEIIWHRYALSVSPTLAGVIDRAIAYHPRDRFASAREMLEVLQSGVGTFAPTVPYLQPPVTPAVSATLQKTISVSPRSSTQPANQGTGQRGIFLASIITGGLIGAAMIIGFALNKSPQPIVKSSTLSESSTRNEPQDTPPVQSPVSSTSEPSISNEPQDNIPVPFLNNGIPSATPSSQLPSTTQPQADRPSPEQAVQNYFETINKREFQTGWNQLSPGYQNNKRLHPDGYLSYIDWWGGKVQSVDIEQVNLVQASAETATVNAKLKYLMNTGKVIPGSVRFFLLWDAQNSRWVVSDTK
ncbi:protein kinase [Komarekiella sp. 'clone 1']|uniref:non-specific serine/threonine protein kinase n=1 Tax=Komarekiella delphini-convector SJRDD-AB1 TaxID=2593771 RepID=A0AA40VQB7_9NOST|nr:serine/threonine-protein kinase [Komarekiella delphini-convector]MBD6615765.1 protein kinase [Komarekiella delphini-convector SJRDD-AB1]